MTNGLKLPTLEFAITEYRLETLPLDSDIISLDLGSAFTVRLTLSHCCDAVTRLHLCSSLPQ